MMYLLEAVLHLSAPMPPHHRGGRACQARRDKAEAVSVLLLMAVFGSLTTEYHVAHGKGIVCMGQLGASS